MHGETGAFDWYTVIVGVFAAAALAAHGVAYLAWKTEGELQARSRRLFRRLWPIVTLLLVAATVETASIQPTLFATFARRPWAGRLRY